MKSKFIIPIIALSLTSCIFDKTKNETEKNEETAAAEEK